MAILTGTRRVLGGDVRAGVAGGLFFAAGDISTKLATDGGAHYLFVISLIAGYVLGTALLQIGYQGGAALTVAGLATLITNAVPIAAGTLLLHESLPSGSLGIVRLFAFVAVTAGAILLARPRGAAALRPPASPPESPARASMAWGLSRPSRIGCGYGEQPTLRQLHLRLMRKLQTQGLHHVTLVGADRETSIGFWEGLLGMPFVFEQPNLDNPDESHLYFDPGDGRLITVFTNETRRPDPSRTATDPGCVHHIALSISQATFRQAVERLDERGIHHSGVKDRGFMDSIYFEDPLGLTIELASYRFEPPSGLTHADVLLAAHELRVGRGDRNITEIHLADAIEAVVLRERPSLSRDRDPKDPY